LRRIAIDGDERIRPHIGEGDPDGKIAARYSERGNVEVRSPPSSISISCSI
jgi:hypothetical protein